MSLPPWLSTLNSSIGDRSSLPEPKFVNVYGALESMPPAYVAGTITLFFIPTRRESIPGYHKRSQSRALISLLIEKIISLKYYHSPFSSAGECTRKTDSFFVVL
jgi:hypothetical protein